MTTIVHFEKSMADLENIVKELENGDLTLEQCLKQYEQGVLLAKQCQDALKFAEQKIETLRTDGVATEDEPHEP